MENATFPLLNLLFLGAFVLLAMREVLDATPQAVEVREEPAE